jgi:anti-sigma B factor antagonist
MQLKLETRNVGGVTVVDCNGRIVFGEESALLRDTLKKLISENNQIVLNLAGINYIDSGGLGTLVALYTSAQSAGGQSYAACRRSTAGNQAADCV